MVNVAVQNAAKDVVNYLNSGHIDFWAYGNPYGVMRVQGMSCTRNELDEAFSKYGAHLHYSQLSVDEVLSRTDCEGLIDDSIQEVVAIHF